MKKFIIISISTFLVVGIFILYLWNWSSKSWFWPKLFSKNTNSATHVSNSSTIRPPICAEIETEGKVTGYRCPFNGLRLWRPLGKISKKLQETVVYLEDAKFWQHSGVDVDEIMNSLEKNLKQKKIARGGSTITQQLVKNLYLTKEKSFFRKASEVTIAMKMEKEMTKSQILELYLNTIEWGKDIYGAEAASRYYFDKEASELTDLECWVLGLMIPNPKQLNLWVHPHAKKSLLYRANQIKNRMVGDKKASEEESDLFYDELSKFLDNFELQNPQTNESILTSRRFPFQPPLSKP